MEISDRSYDRGGMRREWEKREHYKRRDHCAVSRWSLVT